MHTFPQKRERVSTKGFTLVETLVAVSILLVVIVGPMTIASKGMQNAFFAGDQTTAVYLAQEAIEHIQRLRDDDALEAFQDYKGSNATVDDTMDWYTNSSILSNSCRGGAGCDIDFVNGGYKDCSTLSNCLLKRDTSASPGNRVYGYGVGWSNSIFTRVVRVGAVANGGFPVTVTVSWSTNLFVSGGSRSITLQTYVYDHYSRFE